jgi:thiol:disulfide interchange protein
LPGSGKVKDKFQELNIAKVVVDVDALEGSWTFLKERFNRANIPVNIMFPADLSRDPILLPEFMGPGDMLKVIEQAQ